MHFLPCDPTALLLRCIRFHAAWAKETIFCLFVVGASDQ
jgi:hypothetical protein